MVELSSGLETGVVATGLVAMLGMAVWLLFRCETNGEKSLFSKMMSPSEDEIEKRTSVPLFLPSFKGSSSKSLITTHDYGLEVLNQRMSSIPFSQQKEPSMEPHVASTIEIQEGETTGQAEDFRPPFGQFGNIAVGMSSGKKSLGGILVVDDDPAIRKLNRSILEHSGYDVLEAEDGQEALQVLSSGEAPMAVDLIITDINMPKVDGFEAIASFQKEYPSIPVIVLTGIADREVVTSFLRQGVTDYLVKPIDVRILVASVTDAIKQSQLSCAL